MIATIILIIALGYLSLGVLFAIPFLLKGITKVNEDSHGSTIGFKIIIIPGVIVFWPVLLKKWMKTNHETLDVSRENINDVHTRFRSHKKSQ
jgi:hypothetical protein